MNVFIFFFFILNVAAQIDHIHVYNECLEHNPSNFTDFPVFFENTNSEGITLPMKEKCYTAPHELPLGSCVMIIESLDLQLTRRMKEALDNHKEYAAYHEYGYIRQVIQKSGTENYKQLITVVNQRALLLQQTQSFISTIPRGEAFIYIYVIESDAFFTQIDNSLTLHIRELQLRNASFGWSRHPFGKIGMLHNKDLPTNMDTALLIKNTKETRCLVNMWVNLNKSWLERLCSGPGGIVLNLALFYVAANTAKYDLPPIEQRLENTCLRSNNAYESWTFIALSEIIFPMTEKLNIKYAWSILPWVYTQETNEKNKGFSFDVFNEYLWFPQKDINFDCLKETGFCFRDTYHGEVSLIDIALLVNNTNYSLEKYPCVNRISFCYKTQLDFVQKFLNGEMFFTHTAGAGYSFVRYLAKPNTKII